jgi:hypothetical protein
MYILSRCRDYFGCWLDNLLVKPDWSRPGSGYAHMLITTACLFLRLLLAAACTHLAFESIGTSVRDSADKNMISTHVGPKIMEQRIMERASTRTIRHGDHPPSTHRGVPFKLK